MVKLNILDYISECDVDSIGLLSIAALALVLIYLLDEKQLKKLALYSVALGDLLSLGATAGYCFCDCNCNLKNSYY